MLYLIFVENVIYSCLFVSSVNPKQTNMNKPCSCLFGSFTALETSKLKLGTHGKKRSTLVDTL